MCKICGGPNHHGCGCEAKAAREWPGEDAPPDVQPAEPTGPQPTEPTGPQPAEPKPAETAVDYYSKKFLEGLEEYASDNMLSILSYLSNIDQHVKEIHAMVKARIRKDAEKGN